MELNQLYRMKETLKNPKIKKVYDDLKSFCMKYIIPLKPPGCTRTSYGRIYDYSVLSGTEEIDFNDKIICDLGARCGFWGIYLSQFANRVDISDYFTAWGTGEKGGLYDLKTETAMVKGICKQIGTEHKVNIHHQNITNITYSDNTYDIVLCTSVIEHMYTQHQFGKGNYVGDIKGMQEMERICKPGGYVLLSTDMSPIKNEEFPEGTIERWYSGTYWYNEHDLFLRIINSTSLELVGKHDFSFNNPHNDDVVCHHKGGFICSPVILILRKPLIKK